MTVIALTKDKHGYHLHADSRTTQDWLGISTDNSVKIHEGKDCIYGTAGSASAKIVMKDILSKTSTPMTVLRKLHHKDYKDLLKSSSTLVATKKHGCYTINIGMGGLFSSSGPDISIVTWDDDALPQLIGSGFLAVRTLLSAVDEITPKRVQWAIEASYVTNHTIGGPVRHLMLPFDRQVKQVKQVRQFKKKGKK